MAKAVKQPGIAAERPLSVLLSQLLVAFTVEFDNEFERRMADAGHPGALLSLTIWARLIRFVGGGGVTVRDLAAKASVPDTTIKFQLGCLERWGLIVLSPDPIQKRREGWGSGRGIRADWLVRLTSKGGVAAKIWPPLLDVIERRWEKRFGQEEVGRLRQALLDIANKLDAGLPNSFRLPALLSHLLAAFRSEFDREAPAPLELCANTLRVLNEDPIPLAEIARLTGCSPEASAIGWRIKPYVIVEADPNAKRGKVVRLSSRGLAAKQTYLELVGKIEESWEARFGTQEIGSLRNALLGLFNQETELGPVLAQGLVPSPRTIRGGYVAPALGRPAPSIKAIGPAAFQRARDLVAQTEAFINDPAGTLPHYPLWDMNRGFGP